MKNNVKNIIIGVLIGIICILVALIVLIANGTISLGTNDDDEIVDSIKVYDNKDYVYDADYIYNNKYSEYGEGNEKNVVDRGIAFEYSQGKQYLKDLKVPYINIKSSAAENVNGVLKDLYIESAKNFDLYAENVSSPIINKQVLTYRTYEYNNILSVVIIYGGQSTSNWNPNYYTYNFDLTSGDLLSFDNMISKLGYNDKEALLKKAESKIKDKMDELFGGFGDLTKSCYTNNGEQTNCYNVAYNNFRYSVNNDTISFLLDDEGNLSLFFDPSYSNSESGMWSYLVEVGK